VRHVSVCDVCLYSYRSLMCLHCPSVHLSLTHIFDAAAMQVDRWADFTYLCVQYAHNVFPPDCFVNCDVLRVDLCPPSRRWFSGVRNWAMAKNHNKFATLLFRPLQNYSFPQFGIYRYKRTVHMCYWVWPNTTKTSLDSFSSTFSKRQHVIITVTDLVAAAKAVDIDSKVDMNLYTAIISAPCVLRDDIVSLLYSYLLGFYL